MVHTAAASPVIRAVEEIAYASRTPETTGGSLPVESKSDVLSDGAMLGNVDGRGVGTSKGTPVGTSSNGAGVGALGVGAVVLISIVGEAE